MKKTTLFIILLTLASLSFAQTDSTTVSKAKTPSCVYLAYNSSIVYPGIRGGIELPITKIRLDKIKKSGKQKRIYKDRFLTTNLGWYHHASFHDNIYITAGYTLRRTHSKGFFTEFSPELGYSRTFLGGTAYQVDEQGEVSVQKMAGYNYVLASLGAGIGYDFSMTRSKPIAIYYKLNMLTMFPYNSTFYIRPAMELGVCYIPNGFLLFNSKIKNINRNKHQQ